MPQLRRALSSVPLSAEAEKHGDKGEESSCSQFCLVQHVISFLSVARTQLLTLDPGASVFNCAPWSFEFVWLYHP